MANIKKFVGQLVGGETVIMKEYQARQWVELECTLESIKFFVSGEFDCAKLELTFPCGMVKTQTWYQQETIMVVQ